MSARKLSRYELLEEIGRGNMGAVFRARDPGIDRTVAVKILSLGFALDDTRRDTFLSRFQREASIVGRLAHPHIVAVHDVGLGEEPFLVMEYFPGTSLARLLESGPLPPEEARLVLLQLADALAYAHSQGVVHRDIKPANVLYRPGPFIKLVDFGIARLETSELTATGEFMGTPSYMPPEVFAGETVDARSDLFSAGVLLYQLLTGVKPFEGETVSRTIYRVLHDHPTPPSVARPGLERGWDRICGKLLAKKPEQRYRDASALARDLEALGRGELQLGNEDEPTVPISDPRASRARWIRGVAVAGLLPVALLVGVLLARSRSAPVPPPPDVPAIEDGGAQLVDAAETALAEGRLDEAETGLRVLGAFEPDHPRLGELQVELARARFVERLPFVFVARHDHRIGHCTGDLTLGASEIVFTTSRHGTWRFPLGAISRLEQPEPTSLDLTARSPENGERELVRLTFLRPALAPEDLEAYVEAVLP